MWNNAKLLTACAALSLMAGCATAADPVVSEEVVTQYVADKPAGAQHLFESVVRQGERNAVLNLSRAGLAAMQLGHYDVAARSFDEALMRIERVYADNPTAEQARSTFVKESIKDFKGESYERAMVYYYRGLAYLHDNDYENARASFQGGILQDAFAEDQTYKSDLALFEVLAGWSTQCLGQSPADYYGRALELRSDIVIPKSNDRTLVVADIGTSPVKVSDGKYNENLSYALDTSYPERKVEFVTNAGSRTGNFGEDLYWQATTRGGRAIDKILAGKAQFKQGAEDASAGTAVASLAALEVASSAYSQAASLSSQGYDVDTSAADATALFGVGMALFSIGSAMAAEAATPQADTRYWDSLPSRIDYVTLPQSESVTEVRYLGEDGRVVRNVPMTEALSSASSGCKLVWTRSQDATSVPTVAPNSSARAR